MGGFAVSGQALKDGQSEGGGLACAGLGDTQQVFAGHDAGNGLGLNGGGLGVTFVGKRLKQGLVEAEVGKLSQTSSLSQMRRKRPQAISLGRGARVILGKPPRGGTIDAISSGRSTVWTDQ